MAPDPAAIPPVITVSASYGAGGSLLAPRLARELGMPFVDRVVTAAVAAGAPPSSAEPGVSGEEVTTEEKAAMPSNRLFGYLARAAGANAMVPSEAVLDPDTALQEQTAAHVQDLTRHGGLLLGRAGAVVLARRPRTYHIRLDGPAERRLARATRIDDIDLDTARNRLTETDRTRTLFVKRLYRTDPADPALYHLMLDTTVLTLDGALAVLVAAASDFFAGA